MSRELIERFFRGYFPEGSGDAVYIPVTPKNMIASGPDEEGWIRWNLIPNPASASDYEELQLRHGIRFPESFLQWHRTYCFLDGRFSLASFPEIPSNAPLAPLEEMLAYPFSQMLIRIGAVPFCTDGSDGMIWAFDPTHSNAIRAYNIDYGAPSLEGERIILSSFEKALECLSHFIESPESEELSVRISDFMTIDPRGAGRTGRGYWNSMI